MPSYSIHVVNEDFATATDHELPSMGAARTEGIRGALQIGVQEVSEGKSFFGAEITIKNEHEPTERMIVAIGCSPLK